MTYIVNGLKMSRGVVIAGTNNEYACPIYDGRVSSVIYDMCDGLGRSGIESM